MKDDLKTFKEFVLNGYLIDNTNKILISRIRKKYSVADILECKERNWRMVFHIEGPYVYFILQKKGLFSWKDYAVYSLPDREKTFEQHLENFYKQNKEELVQKLISNKDYFKNRKMYL